MKCQGECKKCGLKPICKKTFRLELDYSPDVAGAAKVQGGDLRDLATIQTGLAEAINECLVNGYPASRLIWFLSRESCYRIASFTTSLGNPAYPDFISSITLMGWPWRVLPILTSDREIYLAHSLKITVYKHLVGEQS